MLGARSSARFALPAILIAAPCLLTAACSGSSNPSPNPGAVMVSPDPLYVGDFSQATDGHITATQFPATGKITATSTSEPPCWNLASPSPKDLAQNTGIVSNLEKGTATTTFRLNPLNAGNCTVTFTPAKGKPITVNVSVKPFPTPT